MAQEEVNSLEGLIKQFGIPFLNQFANYMIGNTIILGKHAHPDSMNYVNKITRHMVDGKLTDEGRRYLVDDIKNHQAVKNAYNSFINFVGESILELYA